MSEPATLTKLTSFLNKLSSNRISFTLDYCRDDYLMAVVNVPGERWEVEFCTNGEVEVERFISNGTIDDQRALDELFTRFSDRSSP